MYIIHILKIGNTLSLLYFIFLFAGEFEISRFFFSAPLFDESESDIYSLEHCEICEVVRLDNSQSDVWFEVLREDNDIRSFFIDLLTMLESDMDPLEHCEFCEEIQAHNPLLDDRVETLRENPGVRSYTLRVAPVNISSGDVFVEISRYRFGVRS